MNKKRKNKLNSILLKYQFSFLNDKSYKKWSIMRGKKKNLVYANFIKLEPKVNKFN